MSLTFDQVHHKPIAQRLVLALETGDADGHYYEWLERKIKQLDDCLREMVKHWDGKEHELVEMYPGYDPPWMYDDQMQADDDELYTICPVCDYGINEDEYIPECPTCDEGMCLYCYEGRPCPDHGEGNQ